MNNLLKACIFARVPVLITSLPGVGKTATVQSMARSMDRKLWTIIASYREPADFGGLPVIRKESIKVNGHEFTAVELAPPKYAVEAATSPEGGIIFLDEITCFTGNTLVSVFKDNLLSQKFIKDILPGDMVVAVEEGSRLVVTNEVLNITCKKANYMARVKLSDNTSIDCTADHQFMVDGHWREAKNLVGYKVWKLSDTLSTLYNRRLSEAAQQVEVTSVELYMADSLMYDLTVEDTHNFFANNVLVKNCTPPACQAPLLRIVHELVVGELELPTEKIAVIAAANPPEAAASGWDIAAPLANRFCHLQFKLNTNEWVENFPIYWTTPPKLSLWGVDLKEDRWSQNRVIVSAFIRTKPSLLMAFPDKASQQCSAWPSPRSFDNVSRVMTAADIHGLSKDDRAELVSGNIGTGPAIEFLNWAEQLDLPDPEDILAKPDSYKFPTRGDRQFAVLSSVVAAVVAKNNAERWKKGWQVMITAAEKHGAPDVAAATARMLCKNRPPRGAQIPIEADKCFRPMLLAAGLGVENKPETKKS